ncbi:MAG TPA: NADAR domain-containing protein [Myxococcus sp.]|nr:NADAR domain-containing protein [Myxococcus sp.]
MTEVINFYSVTDDYGWCSKEHYFQAQKFEDPADQEEVRQARTPMLAARMGRDRKRKLRRDWESTKVSVMRDAVRARFSQHEDLKRLLLDTGDAKLVEHTTNDDYWGDGGDGSGKNMLGRLLMEVREELRKERA